jgi:alpha/beta superfamily hydrolase
MHSKVVYRAARATRDVGMPTLRFNFRGVGRSAGAFDGGIGEAEDVRAALDRLAIICPDRPLVAGGFSFGAWLSVAVGAADPRVAALISIGTPISIYGSDHLSAVQKPILFVHGSSDPFCPSAELDAAARRLPESVRVVRIEGAGHLLTGREEEVYDAVREFLRDSLDRDDGEPTLEADAGNRRPPGGS